jgi:hypothetical protein
MLSTLLVSAAVIAGLTDGLLPLIGAVAIIVMAAASRRLNGAVATALAVIGVLLIVLISGMLALVVGVPLADSVTISMVFAGGAGLATFAIADRSRSVMRSAGLPIAAWLAAASGAIVWAIAYAVSMLLPAVERLEWVVRNDSLNNLVFARMVLQEGGIAVGGSENPAPLPATLIALGALDARFEVGVNALLQHDLEAMSQVWALLIGLTCLLSGLTVASLARTMGGRGVPLILGATFGSLLGLSWMVTGYPMLYGFLNTHLILPVLLSMILLGVWARDAPVVALVGLLVGSTVILAVWAPLVVVPASLFIAVVLACRHRLWPLKVWHRVVLLAAAAQLIVYGVVITVPIYLEQRPALGGVGGIFDFASLMLPTALGITVLLALAIRKGEKAIQPIPVVVAVFASAVAGLSFLLFLNRNANAIWTYYPIKFSWLMLIILLIVVLGMLVGLSSQSAPRSLRVLLLSAASALFLALMLWMPTIGGGPLALNAVHRVVLGHVADRTNGLTSGILDNHRPGELTLLWESGEPAEGEINIWLTLLYIGSLDERTDLRILSLQAFTDRSVTMLCAISEKAADDLVVFTERDDLESAIQQMCSERSSEIQVRTST